ncbi:unnamed protein product [Ilex paraguariensis]|uniref:Uncharacterized protein n=1 Tax=Ilex paraguariensis TaxID=185542 RepID=A0ABC8SHF7_9AQUA
MTTPNLLSRLLRRSQPTATIFSSSSNSLLTQSHHHHQQYLTKPYHNRITNTSKSILPFPSSSTIVPSLAAYNHFSFCRSFSTRDSLPEVGGTVNFDGDPASSELSNLGVGGANDIISGSETVEALVNVSGGEESILLVRALISMLDLYHDFSGLPWWIIIASSTLALRMILFPILILQLNKLKRIGELFPRLPPPWPPPLSGRSFRDQITLFQRERRAVGCPSFLWFLAYVSIQVILLSAQC